MKEITKDLMQRKIINISSLLSTFISSSIISLILWYISKSISVALFSIVIIFITSSIINIRSNGVKNIYYIILIFQVIFMIMVYCGEYIEYGKPYFNGGSDDLTYEVEAENISELNLLSIDQARKSVLGEYHNSPGFPIFLSLIMKATKCGDGYNTLIPRLINIFIFICGLLLIDSISSKLMKFTIKQRKYLISLLGFSPLLAYINSHVFRDTLLMTLSIIFIYYLLTFYDSKMKILNIIVAMIILLIISSLRMPMIPYLLILVPILLIKNKRNIIVIICIILVGIIVVKPNILLNLTGYYNNYYDVYNEIILESNSLGLSSIIFSLPLFPIGFILRTLYGLITPFPDISACIRVFLQFNLLDFIRLLLAIGTIIQLYLCIFLLDIKSLRSKILPIFVIFYFAYVFGTFTFRHMILFYPFMVLLIISNLRDMKKKKIIKRISIITIILFLAISIYIITKF